MAPWTEKKGRAFFSKNKAWFLHNYISWYSIYHYCNCISKNESVGVCVVTITACKKLIGKIVERGATNDRSENAKCCCHQFEDCLSFVLARICWWLLLLLSSSQWTLKCSGGFFLFIAMLFELLLLPIAVEYATDLSQTTVTYFSRKVCTYHLQKDLLNDNQRFALSLSLAFIWKISKATFLKHPRIYSSKKKKHHRVSIMVNIHTKRHTDRWWRREKQRDKCENSLCLCHHLLHKLYASMLFSTNNAQTSSSQTMLKTPLQAACKLLVHKR